MFTLICCDIKVLQSVVMKIKINKSNSSIKIWNGWNLNYLFVLPFDIYNLI